MGTGRFWATAIAVWLVRTVMNALVYGVLLAPRLAAVAAQHPGMFRTVVPAYIVADLLFAIVFTLLFSKVGAALGGGIALGLFVAILAPAIGSVYELLQRHVRVGQTSVGYRDLPGLRTHRARNNRRGALQDRRIGSRCHSLTLAMCSEM